MDLPDYDEDQSSLHRHLFSGWRFRAMISTIILAAVGYLFFTLWAGWHEVLNAFYKVGWPGILIVPMLSLVNYFLRFLRWQYYLHVLGHHPPILTSLRIYMSGFTLTTTPGKTGEALRSVFLKDYGIPYRQSFGAFFSERLSDLIAVLLISLLGIMGHPQLRIPILGIAAGVIVVIYIFQRDGWLKWIENKASKLFPSRFAHSIEFVIETIIAFKSCYQQTVLMYATILGVIAWCFEGIGFYYILRVLAIDITLPNALFIYAFSLMIGGITFMPGGLGGAEFTLMQLLIYHGAQPADAVAATLFIRISTLWLSVLIGICSLPKSRLAIK